VVSTNPTPISLSFDSLITCSFLSCSMFWNGTVLSCGVFRSWTVLIVSVHLVHSLKLGKIVWKVGSLPFLDSRIICSYVFVLDFLVISLIFLCRWSVDGRITAQETCSTRDRIKWGRNFCVGSLIYFCCI
jgi:hypothetical protein